MEQKIIALKYVKFYFWIDLISSAPQAIFVLSRWDHCPLSNNIVDTHLQCAWQLVNMMTCLKFFRLPRFFTIIENLLKRRDKRPYTFKIIKVCRFSPSRCHHLCNLFHFSRWSALSSTWYIGLLVWNFLCRSLSMAQMYWNPVQCPGQRNSRSGQIPQLQNMSIAFIVLSIPWPFLDTPWMNLNPLRTCHSPYSF